MVVALDLTGQGVEVEAVEVDGSVITARLGGSQGR
jgi:hypothetical protein